MAAGFTRWPWWRRWFGLRAERAAARFFKAQGYRILAANHNDGRGELDLIAYHSDTIIVIEVRSSQSRTLPELLETVNAEKQRRISDATLRYLQKHRLLGTVTVRFDVIAIRWPQEDAKPEYLHIQDAFQAVGRRQFFN